MSFSTEYLQKKILKLQEKNQNIRFPSLTHIFPFFFCIKFLHSEQFNICSLPEGWTELPPSGCIGGNWYDCPVNNKHIVEKSMIFVRLRLRWLNCFSLHFNLSIWIRNRIHGPKWILLITTNMIALKINYTCVKTSQNLCDIQTFDLNVQNTIKIMLNECLKKTN